MILVASDVGGQGGVHTGRGPEGEDAESASVPFRGEEDVGGEGGGKTVRVWGEREGERA